MNATRACCTRRGNRSADDDNVPTRANNMRRVSALKRTHACEIRALRCALGHGTKNRTHTHIYRTRAVACERNKRPFSATAQSKQHTPTIRIARNHLQSPPANKKLIFIGCNTIGWCTKVPATRGDVRTHSGARIVPIITGIRSGRRHGERPAGLAHASECRVRGSSCCCSNAGPFLLLCTSLCAPHCAHFVIELPTRWSIMLPIKPHHQTRSIHSAARSTRSPPPTTAGCWLVGCFVCM